MLPRMEADGETRSVNSATGDVSAHDVLQQQLVILFERARPLAGGARHSLANIDRVTIGRGERRAASRLMRDGRPTLLVSVPDDRMSASHALLERKNGGWSFVDCESTNGCRINRARVTAKMLSDGDVLELGGTLFRYRDAVSTPVNAPGDVDAKALCDLPRAFGTLLPSLGRDLETLARVAKSDIAILLLGETGTGKEVLARAIHEQSRRTGAFVAVNCGALPGTLVESLLFGHKKGAFSGATQDEVGLVRAAEGGTLFLDEIGDLPSASQAALLRVLQEREVVPVGATRPVRVETRVVSATHRPLRALVDAGQFRHDLLARLSGFEFVLPPLRERIDDIGVLVAALLRSLVAHCGPAPRLSGSAAYALIDHGWPNNVRELAQRLEVSALLSTNGRIELTRTSEETELAKNPGSPPLELSSEERALHAELLAQLVEHRGNVTHVGKAMGKARSQVQRWVRRFGIDTGKFRG